MTNFLNYTLIYFGLIIFFMVAILLSKKISFFLEEVIGLDLEENILMLLIFWPINLCAVAYMGLYAKLSDNKRVLELNDRLYAWYERHRR